jgi:hypothetical protein
LITDVNDSVATKIPGAIFAVLRAGRAERLPANPSLARPARQMDTTKHAKISRF